MGSRVYFDADTGNIIHVHRVVSADALEQDRIDEEMAVFEQSIEQRHGRALESLDVDEAELQKAVSPDVVLKVDIANRRLVVDGM
jgi:hypothetical protein